jgi:hypothetical protein
MIHRSCVFEFSFRRTNPCALLGIWISIKPGNAFSAGQTYLWHIARVSTPNPGEPGVRLPLGFTSQAEILDAWLEHPVPLPDVQIELTIAAPPGITITQIDEIDLKVPALQTQVSSSEYTVTFLTPVPDLDQKLAVI